MIVYKRITTKMQLFKIESLGFSFSGYVITVNLIPSNGNLNDFTTGLATRQADCIESLYFW